ncbi:type IV toxin-antitoxin system AbiEi family antitoxin domain-containing protein [Ornithinimicrobium tianjinense]|uniref:AbiEi antitoxin N-terminal domain-containing protein n=1 Tax=Ornithinimicrobium tianjinense TaxID=1195761 RepID=A0A917F2P3_9MICO|nr:type IV toxin-antitoxin system AbiEi family antitoxin domain-containing protein [Ornithinimicrobium tianjinense]GGF42256.1 hypothetical protein GCM10011366_07570 [Ornithinimicrobium tianjinense]
MTIHALPRPFSRSQAEAAGLSRRALDEALRRGLARRVRRGWYVASESDPSPEGERWVTVVADHLDRLRQHLRRFPGHVASHTSAALLHGFGVMISPATPVDITSVDRAPRSWREAGLRVHHSDSSDIPVTTIDGLRVTAELRTVVDTLRTRRLPHATALVDEVLRTGRLSTAELETALDAQKRWSGRPRALVAIELSDPRRETWLESYSDVSLYEHGVPLPLPQVNIFDEDRVFLGRVDGLDPELGVFREADGLGKYFADAGTTSPEESVLEHLGQEHSRHTRLEALGLRGARWMASEVMEDPEGVAARVKALHRAPVPPLSGYAEWDGELRRLPFSVERTPVNLEKARTRRERRPRT